MDRCGFSWRGMGNFFVIFMVVIGVVTLFTVYPVFVQVQKDQYLRAHPSDIKLNSTGQVPELDF